MKNVLRGTWDTITDLQREIWASVTDRSLFRFFGNKSEGGDLPHLVQ